MITRYGVSFLRCFFLEGVIEVRDGLTKVTRGVEMDEGAVAYEDDIIVSIEGETSEDVFSRIEAGGISLSSSQSLCRYIFRSFPSRYLSGMILLTLCSMVWDWRVLRAGTMPFCWPSFSLRFLSSTFYRSLFSFYGLVLWGWGH